MLKCFPSIILFLSITVGLSITMGGCSSNTDKDDGSSRKKPLTSASIVAATGGTVSVKAPHPLAGTSIVIPPGALAEDTVISINEAKSPINSGTVDLAIDIEPDGTAFHIPATVTIVYDDAEIPSNVAEDTLSIAQVRADSSLITLTKVIVDPVANTVQGGTRSLSIFAIVTREAKGVLHPPIADAGPDQIGIVGETVTLTGSGSSDTDGDPLRFLWFFVSLPAGSTTTLSDPTALEPSFVVDLPGIYVVQLIVNDGMVNSEPDTVIITTENRPPVADAGIDQIVFVGETVSLDGSLSSDADGDLLDFQWIFISLPSGSTTTLLDPTVVNPSFITDRGGKFVVQLIVNDSIADSIPDIVIINALIPATSSDLENRIFLFADGIAFAEGLVGTRVELTFGNFRNPKTGPFTLRAPDVAGIDGQLAKVEGTFSSCNLQIEESTFDPKIFPELQRGRTLLMESCGISIENGFLGIVNAETGARSISDPPSPKIQYNFVVILTDDQRWDTLWVMPIVQEKLVARGVTFTNAFVSTPICCPTRASILSGGFYAHNTGVLTNRFPNGGAQKFLDTETLATLLQNAGYQTGLIGKYLNEYHLIAPYIPPGWTTFVETTPSTRSWVEFDAVVGSSGTESSEGEIIPVTQYVTDFQRDQALAFLDQYGEELFFLYFSTNAVHSPSIPAPGDERLFLDYQYRERAYGEKDVSDKPEWVQKIRNVCKSLQEERDEEVRDQLRSLQAIDRAVGAIVEKIEDKGLLDKTVFIFTSDNGFMWCEHGVFSKASHYEESTRVPFLIVIPGIEPRVDEHLVIASLDIGPTIFELGEISKPTDGLSLVPLAKYHYIPWREEILLENFGTDEFGSYGQWGVWSGLRIKRTHEEWKYVEYPTGEKELYDLIADPYEEESQHNHPSYQLIVQDLSERLRKLRGLAVTVFKVPAGIVDQAYTFQLTAWGGNEPYSWDIFKGRLPEGLSLDSSSGLISGVPVKQEERRVQIRVTDSSIAKQTGKPQSYIQEFSFVISP